MELIYIAIAVWCALSATRAAQRRDDERDLRLRVALLEAEVSLLRMKMEDRRGPDH